MRKAVSGIMLLLLLLSLLIVSLNIPSTLGDLDVTRSLDHCTIGHGSGEDNPSAFARFYEGTSHYRANRGSDFSKIDNDRLEMIIGVSDAKQRSYEQLRHLITENNGTLLNTVSMNGKTTAIVVGIATTSALALAERVKTAGLSRYIEPNVKFQASFVPNDPYWLQQWAPVKIGADYAWNTTVGDPSVLIAVIDTGIDWKHPDLASNYVALGYDWVNNDTDPMDDNGHGSHCAGIITAAINNSEGIAGLAQVRIMAEKALDDWGAGTEDDLATAIIHAVDQGADIISCSWGSYLRSTLIHEAIKYAYEREVLVVAAAGNDNTRARSYPAAYDEVVAVSATDSYDDMAEFTNFGDWIELAAPGVDIYSTVLENSYALKSGTSMSCPHVAGVAALAWSRFANATRDWVRLWLRYTADDLGGVGFDTFYGYGRINARRAVEETPPDHDVVISNWQNPPYLEPGSQDVVNTTVLNFGAENETSITVQLLVNGSIADSATIDFLASRKSATVKCLWTPSSEGIYNVTSYVVSVINETRIENNVMSRYVFVGIKTVEVPTLYTTIQEAIDLVGSGFTILVRAGTYYENVVIGKDISLIGEDRDTTVIDANAIGTVVTVEADNVNISNFTIRNSGTNWFDSGVLLFYSNGITILNNTMTLNNFGVYLTTSSNCTFANNNLTGNAHYGFSIELAFNCTLSGNNVAYNFQGIELNSSPNNSLHENNVWQCPYGIVLLSCPNSTLYGNNVTNGHWGIYLHYCPNSKLRNNTMIGGGWSDLYNFDVWGWELSDFLIDIDISNTVNGKPVYYWINMRDRTVPSNAGYVGLVNSTNIIVKDLNLLNNGVGVLLAYTNDSLITNNTLINNEYAAQLSHSWANVMYGNNITANKAGISLDASSNNSLFENSVIDVFREWGILLNAQSNNNSVCRNNVTDIFNDGIMIWYNSNNNSIFENNITNSDLYAVDVRYSSDNNLIWANNVVNNFKPIGLGNSSSNVIFHNNFINNAGGPDVYASTNVWDDGYPSGGNYWSNYTGVDEKSGPNQEQPVSDGIGDTPYVIDANNQDHYPLMKPYSGLNDIGITSITASKTTVGQGFNLNITIKILNHGISTQTFNLTAYANTTHIQTITNIVLTSRNSTTITFIWNTTGFAKGNYTISTCAWPVTDETDIADNTLTDGIVLVAVPCDITGGIAPGVPDGVCNMRDIGYVCNHFTPVAGNPKMELVEYRNCDLNNDGVVDMRDIGIVCGNFGKT